MTVALSEDDELLAAETAFGLIEGPERQAAEARLGTDAAFAEAYARWQGYAVGLFDDAGEMPPPSMWSAIEARLPANDGASSAAPRSLRWWQAGTLVASAAALVLGMIALQAPKTVVVRVPVARAPAAPLVAVLTGKAGVVTISVDPVSGRITSAATGLEVGNRTPELWVIPADGKPRSLGQLRASLPAWVKVPQTALGSLGSGATIAVSLEPIGGSPTGQPTGPVVLTGKLVTV